MSLEHKLHELFRDALTECLPPLLDKLRPPPEGTEDERETTVAAARILGISPITMAIWRTKGQGPDFDKIGGRIVRYRRSVLEAYARENRGRLGKKGRPRKQVRRGIGH